MEIEKEGKKKKKINILKTYSFFAGCEIYMRNAWENCVTCGVGLGFKVKKSLHWNLVLVFEFENPSRLLPSKTVDQY